MGFEAAQRRQRHLSARGLGLDHQGLTTVAFDHAGQPFTLAAEGGLLSVLATQGKAGRACPSPMQAKIAAAHQSLVDRQESQGRQPDSQSSKRELLSLLLEPREGRESRVADVGGLVGLSARPRGLGGPERGE